MLNNFIVFYFQRKNNVCCIHSLTLHSISLLKIKIQKINKLILNWTDEILISIQETKLQRICVFFSNYHRNTTWFFFKKIIFIWYSCVIRIKTDRISLFECGEPFGHTCAHHYHQPIRVHRKKSTALSFYVNWKQLWLVISTYFSTDSDPISVPFNSFHF